MHAKASLTMSGAWSGGFGRGLRGGGKGGLAGGKKLLVKRGRGGRGAEGGIVAVVGYCNEAALAPMWPPALATVHPDPRQATRTRPAPVQAHGLEAITHARPPMLLRFISTPNTCFSFCYFSPQHCTIAYL